MADASPALPAALTSFPAVPLTPANDPSSSVAVLTRRLAAGNEAAFREFHAAFFDRLYQFLLVVTRGDAHAAQEALQETLLRVVRHAREFKTEEVFWSWLKVVARSAARDGHRKRRRYAAVLERFGFSRTNTEAEGGSHEADLHALLDETLAELDMADRVLIAGKYLHGATVAELAAEIGLTEKAVESRLLRLRRQLGETLLKKLQAP